MKTFMQFLENQQDFEYAKRFAARMKAKGSKFVADYRNTMKNIILKCVQDGFIGFIVTPTGITEEDKERMSAYRLEARKMGFEVGEFKFNPQTYMALATIRKI